MQSAIDDGRLVSPQGCETATGSSDSTHPLNTFVKMLFKLIMAIIGLLTVGYIWWKGLRGKKARWAALIAVVMFINASDRLAEEAFGLPCYVVFVFQVAILAGLNYLVYFLHKE